MSTPTERTHSEHARPTSQRVVGNGNTRDRLWKERRAIRTEDFAVSCLSTCSDRTRSRLARPRQHREAAGQSRRYHHRSLAAAAAWLRMQVPCQDVTPSLVWALCTCSTRRVWQTQMLHTLDTPSRVRPAPLQLPLQMRLPRPPKQRCRPLHHRPWVLLWRFLFSAWMRTQHRRQRLQLRPWQTSC